MAKKFFDIPVTVGVQGGVRQFCFTIQMRLLQHIIEIDRSGNTMQRSQRPVNLSRTFKISDYVTSSIKNSKPYILPTISGNLDGEAEFTPFEGQTDVGILRLYRGVNIKFFDGQHRASTINNLIGQLSRFRDTISILLTDNIDLQTRQQFFSDINYNAVKPSAAQNKAYDKRDNKNALAAFVAENSYSLQHSLDYEKNVVTGSNTHLFSFKTLYDCLVKMYNLTDKSVITDQMKTDAATIMQAWAQKMFWGVLSSYGIQGYRQRYIGTHAVLVIAIGLATRYLLEKRSVDEIVELLNEAEFHHERSFIHEDWERRCVDPDTWKMKCDTRAVKLTASKLLQMLEVILPEELKQLEIETFGTDPESFLTSEEPKAYSFKEDEADELRAEPPADKDEWKQLLKETFSEELRQLQMSDYYIEITLAKNLADIESELTFKITRAEFINKLKELVQAHSISELNFLWNVRETRQRLKNGLIA